MNPIPVTITRGGPHTQGDKGRGLPERRWVGMGFALGNGRKGVVGRAGRFGYVAVVHSESIGGDGGVPPWGAVTLVHTTLVGRPQAFAGSP